MILSHMKSIASCERDSQGENTLHLQEILCSVGLCYEVSDCVGQAAMEEMGIIGCSNL